MAKRGQNCEELKKPSQGQISGKACSRCVFVGNCDGTTPFNNEVGVVYNISISSSCIASNHYEVAHSYNRNRTHSMREAEHNIMIVVRYGQSSNCGRQSLSKRSNSKLCYDEKCESSRMKEKRTFILHLPTNNKYIIFSDVNLLTTSLVKIGF